MPIKVAVVEDEERIREGLEALINGTDDLRCMGAYSNAEAALQQLPRDWPDVVLMDINLPKMSGIECVRQLKELRPTLQILMLTICADDDQIFDALKKGASGYLIKKTPSARILEAIVEAHDGGSPMSSMIARKVVQYLQKDQATPKPESLSNREYEILSHLAKGYQYKEIADALGLSVRTVSTHITHIYGKLHVHSRTEAVVKFLQSEKK
jgi:DNA-binding NarL/FixJ family response regulator